MMTNLTPLSAGLCRKAENTELSIGSLEAIAAIRARLDALEQMSMISARDKGATMEDIADALGLTPQAIYYRFRNMRNGHDSEANGQAAEGQDSSVDA